MKCPRCERFEEDIIAIHERANRAEAALREIVRIAPVGDVWALACKAVDPTWEDGSLGKAESPPK